MSAPLSPSGDPTPGTETCVFCAIVAGTEPADIIRRWRDAVAFRPLNPVVRGHVLVVPIHHITDARTSPVHTGETFRRAAELASEMTGVDVNLITSAGPVATQSVFHLHVHVVPRVEGDGLALPWSPPVPPVGTVEPDQQTYGQHVCGVPVCGDPHCSAARPVPVDGEQRAQIAEELAHHHQLLGPRDDNQPAQWFNWCECGWDGGPVSPGLDTVATASAAFRLHLADELLTMLASEPQASYTPTCQARHEYDSDGLHVTVYCELTPGHGGQHTDHGVSW